MSKKRNQDYASNQWTYVQEESRTTIGQVSMTIFGLLLLVLGLLLLISNSWDIVFHTIGPVTISVPGGLLTDIILDPVINQSLTYNLLALLIGTIASVAGLVLTLKGLDGRHPSSK